MRKVKTITKAIVGLMIASMPFSAEARQWSLKDCIDYALANNISLQKTRLQAQSAHEDYLQSKAALLPSLSASTNQNVNYTPWVANGISGDGYSKASIDKVYYNGTYSVMGNYTLYDGGKRQAQMKLNKLGGRGCTTRFCHTGSQTAGADSPALRPDTLLHRGHQREPGELSVELGEREPWQGDGKDRQDVESRLGSAHRSESTG